MPWNLNQEAPKVGGFFLDHATGDCYKWNRKKHDDKFPKKAWEYQVQSLTRPHLSPDHVEAPVITIVRWWSALLLVALRRLLRMRVRCR